MINTESVGSQVPGGGRKCSWMQVMSEGKLYTDLLGGIFHKCARSQANLSFFFFFIYLSGELVPTGNAFGSGAIRVNILYNQSIILM